MIQVWYKYPFTEEVNYLKGERQADFSENAFVIQAFGQSAPLYISLENKQKVDLDSFLTGLNQQQFKLRGAPEITETAYEELVEEAVSNIKKGEMGKVVLARQKLVSNKTNPLTLFKRLCEKHPNCFVHLIYEPNQVCSVGASPELLLEANNTGVKSVSMAGTLVQGKGEFTQKENEEQAFVTNYIIDQFKSLEIMPKIVNATIDNSAIQHLYSTIKARQAIEIETALNLLSKLHPTPAVCGYPLEASRSFILEKEGFNREWYSGYLGVVKKDELKVYVNLRCAKLYQEKAILYAGAGITKDSDAHSEFLETEAKMEVLGSFL